MWPRWTELLLGAWLVASPAVFPTTPLLHQFCGGLIAALAVVALWRIRFVHLAELLPALVLAIDGWLLARHGEPPDPASQNAIVLALLVATFAILPNDAAAPPPAWRDERG